MSWRSKVVWSQGMFLQPQHFQQEARWTERLVDTRTATLSPHAWGHFALEIDEAALPLGQVGIARCVAVLPDGTPISIPQLDAAPAPLAIGPDLKNEVIWLAAPASREDRPEVGYADEAGAATPEGRYLAGDESVLDAVDFDAERADIQTARLRLRLVRERDLSDDWCALGVVRVQERRSDGLVELDRRYVPPQVRLDATPPLAAHLKLLHGLVRQRAQALASRMGQLGHGVSEMADFLMLQILNRHEPLLRQMALAPSRHPEQAHDLLLMFAGELCTLTQTARRPAEWPLYDHLNPQLAFEPLVDALREMLSVVLEQRAQPIELVPRKYGVHTATLPDPELARQAGFVLAVAAQLPAEQLRSRFPAQTCVAPVDLLRKLVNNNLPGIALRPLPVAPRQLPFHAGHHYFELDRGGELWPQFAESGSLALHVAGEFPGLEMALWAIRQ